MQEDRRNRMSDTQDVVIANASVCLGQCDVAVRRKGEGTYFCILKAGHVGDHSWRVFTLGTMEKTTSVNHPAHYGGDVPHETFKCLEAWGLESDALLWNVVKYISRAGKKGEALEDLKKARWYLERRIAALEAK